MRSGSRCAPLRPSGKALIAPPRPSLICPRGHQLCIRTEDLYLVTGRDALRRAFCVVSSIHHCDPAKYCRKPITPSSFDVIFFAVSGMGDKNWGFTMVMPMALGLVRRLNLEWCLRYF